MKLLRGVRNVLLERARRLEETAMRYRALAENPKSDEAKAACLETEVRMPKLDQSCIATVGYPRCMGAIYRGRKGCYCTAAPRLQYR